MDAGWLMDPSQELGDTVAENRLPATRSRGRGQARPRRGPDLAPLLHHDSMRMITTAIPCHRTRPRALVERCLAAMMLQLQRNASEEGGASSVLMPW